MLEMTYKKRFRTLFYSVNSIFGNHWAMWYLLLGGRGIGKSYSVMEWGVRNKVKNPDKFKFYWCRLTEMQQKMLLTNGADKLVDPDIARRYRLKLTTKGTTVYTYDEKWFRKKNGEEYSKKTNLREFCNVLACSTMANSKGVGYFDKDFDGQYFIVLDEMNREMTEKNNFDVVYAFANMLENIIRTTKVNIKIVCIGNTLDEASDILCAFNFLPEHFGRYKLRSKRCVIDYLEDNDFQKERKKGSALETLQGNSSAFTNQFAVDRSLIVSKRLATSPQQLIKFTKDPGDWFTLWNGNIVKKWNGEIRPVIAMRRYLDESYSPDVVKAVYEMADARAYKFTNTADMRMFQKCLKLLKK